MTSVSTPSFGFGLITLVEAPGTAETDSCTNTAESGDISPVTCSQAALVSSLPAPLGTVVPIRRGLIIVCKTRLLMGLMMLRANKQQRSNEDYWIYCFLLGCASTRVPSRSTKTMELEPKWQKTIDYSTARYLHAEPS